MNLFPRIGAYLTGGPADEAVLRYAATLARLNDGERVFVLGVPEDSPLAEEGGSFDGRVRALLREHGGDALAEASTVDAHEKPSLDDILKATRERELDLLILGRRLPSNQLGRPSLYPKLVRKAPCSVLLVTQYAEPRFGRVLVPVDLSEHSALAISTARELSAASVGAEARVICQRIHAVPYGYAYTGHSREEFAEEQRKNAEEDHQRFLSGLGLAEGDIICRHSVSEHAAAAVCEMAAAERADLVVIGSRGRTAATALLLGSTAEKVVSACATPVLVIKRKGETLPFLKALLGE